MGGRSVGSDFGGWSGSGAEGLRALHKRGHVRVESCWGGRVGVGVISSIGKYHSCEGVDNLLRLSHLLPTFRRHLS